MRETIMLSFLAVLLCVNAFHRGMVPRSLRFMTFQSDRVTGAPTRLAGGKVDLFSDDLFEDDEEEQDPMKVSAGEPEAKEPPKKKYLEENWELNTEDAKEFEGFPEERKPKTPMTGDAPEVPCFALMYKFRREYQDASIDSMIADHKGHCAKFKRLMNSDVINMGKSKGVVLLWAGLSVDDKAETKADIMSFLEDDPLITKDAVEKWDLIDLEMTEEVGKLPPLKAGGA